MTLSRELERMAGDYDDNEIAEQQEEMLFRATQAPRSG